MKKVILVVLVLVVVSAVVLVGVRYRRFRTRYTPPKPLASSFKTPEIEVSSRKEVVVAIHIGAEGKVIEDSIVKSSGDSVVDAHALVVAAQYRFEPATRGGKPVDEWANIPIKYHPRGDSVSCPVIKREIVGDRK